jgi:hypothetical protein
VKTRIAAALFFCAAASAGATTTADFLSLDVGARATAMGGAYSAVAGDATSVYWNPATLTRIEHRSVTMMAASYVDSSYFDYAAYGQNLGKWGAVGAGFQYYSAGSISATDAVGNDAGSFTPFDLAATAAYAYRLPEFEFMPDFAGMSLGFGVKYIQSKIVATAHTTALDVGALSPEYLDGRLRFAFTATNLGGQLVYGLAREPLPRALRFGSSFALTPSWLLSADAGLPVNGQTYGTVGTEYWMALKGPWKFACRAGFDSETLGSVTGFTGVSLGFGLNYLGRAFDYAFVPLGGIGQAHRVSLTYDF